MISRLNNLIHRFIILFAILCFSIQEIDGQCLGSQSHTITPAGPYSPGQTITVSYTLSNFVQF